jgi:glycogen debranching enzyme
VTGIRSPFLLLAAALLGPAAGSAQTVDTPREVAGRWTITGPARPGAYIDAIGRSAAWLGEEQGRLEAWIWPWKLGHDFNLSVRTGEVGGEIDLGPLARTVAVHPWGVEITYVDSRFSVRQTLFAHAIEPVLVMRLDVDTSLDLTLVLSFVPDLAPMWPAGLGGQYAFFDAALPGYVLSESRRQVNAVIVSAEAARGSAAPAHQLAGAGAFEIPVSRTRAAAGPVVVVVTAGSEAREKTVARGQAFAARGRELLAEREAAWSDLPKVTLDLPEPALQAAWDWGVASLLDGFQYTPGLGTGLVAGFGPTGSGYRPGFSWYFGGDTSINAFGLVAAGQGWVLKETFPFLERFQREDGKMMHELTRSAPLLDWFGAYPYAYIHGDTTPFYVVALADYVRWTGNLETLHASWPHLLKAYEFGKWADEDGDGLMDNSRAGLGASELGSLREGLQTDVFLATVWTQALADLAGLAPLAGDPERAAGFRAEHERAKARLASLFTDPDTGTLNFGVAVGGEPKRDATAWSAWPIAFGLVEGPTAENTLDRLASARLSTDWGVRMLAEDSPYYDPIAYNNGAVWPFLTGWVARAEYAAGRRHAGYQHLQQLAWNTFIDARGRHPEVMSGDYFTVLETSVPHQLFSSSPIPADLIRGLLGIELDLPAGRLAVRPQLPGGWLRMRLDGYPLPGGSRLELTVTRRRSGGKVVYGLEVAGPTGLEVVFAPRPAPLEGLDEDPATGRIGRDGRLRLTREGAEGLDLGMDHLAWRRGEEDTWRTRPREGDPPSGLKVVQVRSVSDRAIELVLEGRPGCSYRVPLLGCRIERVKGEGIEVGLEPAEGEGYQVLVFGVGTDTGTPVGVDGYRRFTVRVEVR